MQLLSGRPHRMSDRCGRQNCSQPLLPLLHLHAQLTGVKYLMNLQSFDGCLACQVKCGIGKHFSAHMHAEVASVQTWRQSPGLFCRATESKASEVWRIPGSERYSGCAHLHNDQPHLLQRWRSHPHGPQTACAALPVHKQSICIFTVDSPQDFPAQLLALSNIKQLNFARNDTNISK